MSKARELRAKARSMNECPTPVQELMSKEELPEEEEEEPYVWEPENTLKHTLDSLDIFTSFKYEENGKTITMKKNEIKKSYINFDNWLLERTNEIILHEKEKDLLL